MQPKPNTHADNIHKKDNRSEINTVDTPSELKADIIQLITLESRFASIYQKVGVPSLRRNEGGFTQLMRAMVGQQLSVAAAASIWDKLVNARLTTPATIRHANDDTLRSNGLSKQKVRYIRSLVEHEIDFDRLNRLSDAEVMSTLTAVTGIGNWTAEMYLLFSLGRADVLAVDDLAIKVAAMDMLQLDSRPTPKQLRVLSQPWSPYRSAASLLLWAHYGWLKNRDALPV